MAIELKVPEISEGVDSASVSEILVSEGDQIEEDQGVIAVETDKASTEIPATSAGTVKEIKVSEGDEVSVGDVILILEETDENSEESEEEKDNKEQSSKKNKSEEAEETSEEKEKKPQDKGDDHEEKPDEQEKDETKTKGEATDKSSEEESTSKKKSSTEVHASPGVRRIARELGVNIQEIEGSGESGRITEKDVREHKEGSKGKSSIQKLELPDFSQWGAIETKPLNSIKTTTAKNVLQSWQSIPHVFQFGEADISGIEKYIEDHKEEVDKAGGKLTLTAILTKVVATALHKFPVFNASVDMENEEMILKKYVNINIAVDTEEGLLVPVIKNVDQKSIKDLSIEISEIAQKARDQELSKEDMEGGNFSISNLGGIGGTNFTPIVYHPQVAILGVSQATTKPVYINDNFEPRSMLPLSLSYDHRLIDGADGASFMNWMVQALEDPYEALLG